MYSFPMKLHETRGTFYLCTLFGLRAYSYCVKHCIWIRMFNYICNILFNVKNLEDDLQSMCRLNYIVNNLKIGIKKFELVKQSARECGKITWNLEE